MGLLTVATLAACSHRRVDPERQAGTIAEAQQSVQIARRLAVLAADAALEDAIEAQIYEIGAFNRAVEQHFHESRAPRTTGEPPPTWAGSIPASTPDELRVATRTLLQLLERPCLDERPCQVEQTEAFNDWVRLNRELADAIDDDAARALGFALTQ